MSFTDSHTDAAETPPPRTPEERLRVYVSRRVSDLQRRYLAEEGSAIAALAKLRRGVGRAPGEDLELIGLTTGDLYSVMESRELPDTPTDIEQACYAALTLFAVHQQSQRAESMHRQGRSLGSAVLALSHTEASEAAVTRRFEALGTASSWDEIAHHSRGLVQQLRAAKIPLDYGQLAVDFLALQRADEADAVRNRWGREFYRISRRTLSPESPSTTETAGE